MLKLANQQSKNPPTLSSMMLADFLSQQKYSKTVIRHDNLLSKISKILGVDALKFKGIYLDKCYREKPCYYLPKREACLVAMSYNYEVQAMVFDYMIRLEQDAVNKVSLRPLLGFEKMAIERAIQEKLQAIELAYRLGIARRLKRDMRSFLGVKNSKDEPLVATTFQVENLVALLNKGAETYGALLCKPIHKNLELANKKDEAIKNEPVYISGNDLALKLKKQSAPKLTPKVDASKKLTDNLPKTGDLFQAEIETPIKNHSKFNENLSSIKLFVLEFTKKMQGIYSPTDIQGLVTKNSKGAYFISSNSIGKIANELALNDELERETFFQKLDTGRTVQLWQYRQPAIVKILNIAADRNLLRATN